MSGSRKQSRPTPGESRLRSGGEIECICRLSDYLLLMVGSIGVDTREGCRLWRLCDQEWEELDAIVLPLPGAEDRHRALIFVREPRIGVDLRAAPLVVRTESDELPLEPLDLETRFVDVASVAREYLKIDGDGAALLATMVKGTANERRSRRRLSESLYEIRELVRTSLPQAIVDPAEPRTAQVDAIWGLDDSALYVEGWVRYEGAELTSLVAMSPEGERVELVASAHRYRRPDVAEFFRANAEEQERPSGFIAFFELSSPSLREEGWVLELRDSDGGVLEAPMPRVTHDDAAARATILADFALEPPGEERLKVEHIAPALERLEARRRRGVGIEAVDQHGTPPAEPVASIVVPLFRRVELLEQQLAQFVHDPEISASDLIYVLDSPEDADYLRRFANHLYRLYGVPFRLALLTRNGGFSIVNNLGASLARGRLLLLLNSDVIPERPGWLGEMVRFYDSTPGIGALGPKLLYEDDSIQHAGLYFERPAGGAVWSNEHFFKGLHRGLPAANVARRVPAVTGACMLISSELYRELGGLRGAYVQGDYEDSDLCLRLAEAGHDSWYYPGVALYHLEGQSYPWELRTATSEFNKWLHTHLWGEGLARFTTRPAA